MSTQSGLRLRYNGALPAIKSALVFIVLTLTGCSSSDSGANSDNNFERGPWVYADWLPGDITLNIAQSVWVDEKEPNKIAHSDVVLTTKIPRNLLSICFPYSRGEIRSPFNVNRLPDEVFCNKVGIDINYATGVAITESKEFRGGDKLDEYKKMSQPSEVIFGKLPEDRATLDIRRYYEMAGDITFRLEKDGLEILMRKPEFRKPDFDGFEVYMHGNSGMTALINSHGKDGVSQVSCSTADPKAQPSLISYCTYYFPLNDQLQAEVKFIDLRHHGGRLFMEERVAAFKKWACPIFKCSEQALAEAKVRGGF
jgi:hypothetical protein